MKTAESRVNFFTASPRVAEICRAVMRQNKRLAQCARFEKLSLMTGPIPLVVLAHVDDDPVALSSPKVESALGKAFFILFTEPSTHPEQIAHWMRRTKIHSENRLHIVKVDRFEPSSVFEILNRYCNILGDDTKRGGIIDAYLVGDTLFVRGSKHKLLPVPVQSVPSLRDQPIDKIRNFRIDPDGSFLFWPDLDVHLGWNQFLQIVDPAAAHKAQQRSAAFNERYGAAIRELREEVKIPQSKIPGFTERQIRRIEQGECRATKAALEALANAHGLSMNDYMERVAKAMK